MHGSVGGIYGRVHEGCVGTAHNGCMGVGYPEGMGRTPRGGDVRWVESTREMVGGHGQGTQGCRYGVGRVHRGHGQGTWGFGIG